MSRFELSDAVLIESFYRDQKDVGAIKTQLR